MSQSFNAFRVLKTLTLLAVTLVASEPSLAQDHSATSIDQILRNAWSTAGLESAPLVSDEQFLRRVTLDLVGRIPKPAERNSFLASPDRDALVERLLASDEFAPFWADHWTTQLYGYKGDDSDERDLLAEWLTTQIRSNRPYDQIATELLTAKGESAFSGPVNFLLRYPDEPVVKVSRAFLGVRLDCARCHDHPFDRWTKDDFARMNRFFDGLERQDVSAGNTRLVDVVREVSAEEGPRFLTGAEPQTSQWRSEFSLFLTRSRPFARNFANRLWYHFLGRGIVHPVDDVNRDNPAAIPELLDWLADETRSNAFDLRHMIRLICRSQSYQAQSMATQGDEQRLKFFAVRSMKPLTPEQWYASMCIATGQESTADERMEFVSMFFGDALNADFSSSWEYRETVQGLMSRLVDPVTLPSRDTDELFVRFLGRSATPEERALCSGRSPQDIGFMLLHSSEFAFNH